MSEGTPRAEGAQPLAEMKEYRSNKDDNLLPGELCYNHAQRVYEMVTITVVCTRKSGHTGYHSNKYYYWDSGCPVKSIRDYYFAQPQE